MAEDGETFLKIFQSITDTNTQLVDILLRMEQRQQEHNAALAQILDRMDARMRDLAARTQTIDARIAADNRALAEIFERIVQTTTHTEQMTARILAEVAKGAPE